MDRDKLWAPCSASPSHPCEPVTPHTPDTVPGLQALPSGTAKQSPHTPGGRSVPHGGRAENRMGRPGRLPAWEGKGKPTGRSGVCRPVRACRELRQPRPQWSKPRVPGDQTADDPTRQSKVSSQCHCRSLEGNGTEDTRGDLDFRGSREGQRPPGNRKQVGTRAGAPGRGQQQVPRAAPQQEGAAPGEGTGWGPWHRAPHTTPRPSVHPGQPRPLLQGTGRGRGPPPGPPPAVAMCMCVLTHVWARLC